MNIYNWEITNLYTIDVNSEKDYVVTAIYDVSATDGTYVSNLNGNVTEFVVDDNKPNYVPYAELTNDIVISWVKETLGENGVKSITNCLDGQIESQANPPKTPQNTPLPF